MEKIEGFVVKGSRRMIVAMYAITGVCVVDALSDMSSPAALAVSAILIAYCGSKFAKKGDA